MKTKQLIRNLLVTYMVVITACQSSGPSAAGTIATNPVDTVMVVVLHHASLSKTIELPAELLAYEQAELLARVQGYVKDLKCDIGDRVHRGQILAVIDAPELQTKYAEFQAALEAARVRQLSSTDTYQRLSKASQAKTPGIVAPVDLERSKNQYLADSASYEAARQLAESYREMEGYLVLQAPFDGVITSRHADRGALVGNNQSVLTLQSNKKLRLRVAVPELYVGAATVSKKTSFRVDAYPDKLFEAELSRKSESIDPQTRTELWEYVFDNSRMELKTGSFAYVKIALQRGTGALVVPPTAVATNMERRFVIKVKDGKATWVDVRQGMSTEKGIEIFGDLADGDTLVVRATDERKPGTGAYWKVMQ